MDKIKLSIKLFIKRSGPNLILIAVLAFIVIAGAAGTKFLNDFTVNELIREGEASARTLAKHIDMGMEGLERSASIMAGSPWIKPALVTKSANDIERANLVLDRYENELHASVCYLMDKNGVTIASSNRGTPASFVGKNYAFRPYFKQAISGKQDRYFALGVTSGLRGFYTSYPVKDENNTIVGVAVIKKDIDEWESELESYNYGFFVSPEGVIFLAGRKWTLFKTFGKIDPETQKQLISSREFGEEPLKALTAETPLDKTFSVLGDKRFLVTVKSVGDGGWKIVLFNPITGIILFRSFGVIITILICVVVIGLWSFIRARNKFTASVLQSEERLSQIIDGNPIATFVLDKNHNVLYWNKACEGLTGVKADKIKDSGNISRIFYGKRRPLLTDLIIDGASKTELNMYYGSNVKKSSLVEDGFESEDFFPTLGGNGKWIYFVATPIKDAKGNIIGSIETLQDITQRKTVTEAIRRSEENYRTIFDTANDAIFVHDVETGNITDINKKVVEMYGCSRQECLGLRMEDLSEGAAPYSHDEAVEWIKKTAEEGPQIFEWHAKHKNGKVFWVEVNLKFAVIEGKFRVLAVVRDIDNRKKTEEALAESEIKFKILYDSSHDAIMMLAPPDWSFIDGNNATVELFKAKNKKEFTSKGPADVSPEYQPDGQLSSVKAKEVIAKAIKEGSNFFEWTHKKLSGEEFLATVLLTRVNIGEREFLQATVRDVTAEKRNENEIKLAHSQLDQIFQSAGDGICVFGKEMEIVRINDVMLHLLGISAKDTLKNTCQEIFHKDLCEALDLAKENILAGEKRVETDVTIEHHGGIRIPCILTVSPFYGGGNELVGIIASFKDITERKSAEEALLENVRLKSNFTSVVSHELRTPLTAIKEGIGIVLDGSAGEINDDQKDFLDTAKRNVDRLARLINDVLDFTKLKSGRMSIKFLKNDITQVIEEVAKAQEPVASEKGLYLKTEFVEGLPKVMFDSDRMIQVLTNLVNNALKFTETGGITISAESKEDEIVVSVRDTGPGIKEEDIPKLFQEFRQLEDAKQRKTGGTGLGLAICKEIIEQHNGKIWAESEPGQGTAVKFKLPLIKKYRILVIDDDPEFIKLCEGILRGREYEVLGANRGIEGFEMARENKPDLIVIDMKLPDISGFEVIGRLRSEAELSRIPVVVVSGYSEEMEKIDKLAIPDEKMTIPKLMKPFDNQEFLGVVNTLLLKK